jgi:hypothetical protein
LNPYHLIASRELLCPCFKCLVLAASSTLKGSQSKSSAFQRFHASAPGADSSCGKAVIWFNYELGEKEFYKGFVCEAHRISNRVEKLAQPKTERLSV